ncbi:flagellar hook-length control protein FliK [Roseibium algae]|uniref:Flagellar hook-length control protein FliK n=1 Tax=Roseibium algae TaxID=3123038 RepID=A0ABU8TQM0_9HYPH
MVGHIAALQMASASSRGGAALKLEPGMEVPARVVSSGPDNILRLAVGKQTVDVQASTPLPKGTEVTLKVSGDTARPQIQIIPSAQGTSQSAALQQAGSAGGQPPQSPPSGTTSPTPPVSQSPSQPASQSPTQLQPQALLPDQTGATPGQIRASVTTQILTLPQTAALPQIVSSPNSQVQVSPPSVPAASPAAQPSVQTPGVTPAPSGTSSIPTNSPTPASASGVQTSAVSPPATGSTFASGTGNGTGAPTGSAVLPSQGSPQSSTAGPASQVSTTAPNTGASISGAGGNLQTALPGSPVPGALTGAASSPNTPAQNPAGPQSPLPAGGAPVNGGSNAVPTPPVASVLSASPAQVTAAPQAPAGSQGSSGAVAGQISGQGVAPATGQGAGGSALPQQPSAQLPSQIPLSATSQTSGQALPQTAVPGAAPVDAPASQAPQSLQTPQAGGALAQPGTSLPASASGATLPSTAAPAASAPTSGPIVTAQSAPLTAEAKPPLPTRSAPLAGPASQGSQGLQGGTQASQVSGRLVASYSPSVLLSGADASRAGRLPVSEPLQAAANRLLPGLESQQASLSGVFAQIGALSASVSSGKVSVSKPVQDVMQQILGLRLGGGAASVTGKTIAQSVANSGLFRENTQSVSGKSAALDLKSLLVQLRGMLDGLGVKQMPVKPLVQPPVPGLRNGPSGQTPAAGASLHFVPDGEPEAQAQLTRLMQSTDSALARIRLSQMASRGLGKEEASSRPTGSARAMDVVMDLPLAVGQETAVLQMQIGRDPEHDQGENDAEKAWRLRFGLDLTATGPVEAAVSLRGGGTYVSLWLEREDTHRNLSAQRDTIEAAFAHAGLELQELRFIRGQPIRSKAAAGARVDRQS